MDDDIFYISVKIWKEYLFDKVINPMIKHVEEMIPKVNQVADRKGNTKRLKYLCIAGGLSTSKYFQRRIQQTFDMNSKYKLSIRTTRRPVLSVISGALEIGLQPHIITKRRVPYTYGVAIDKPIKYVDLQKLPHGYLDRYGYVHPTTKQKHVANLFSAFVHKNDVAPVNKPVTRTYRRFHSTEKTCRISIYRSKEKYPYIVKGNPMGFITVTFPYQYQELEFKIHFYFGDTTIKVFALNEQIQIQYFEDSHAQQHESKQNDQPTIKFWQCFMCNFSSNATTVDVCTSCKCTSSASRKIKLQQDKIKQLNQENQNLKQMNKSLQIHAYKVEHESQIKKQFIYRRAQQNKFNTGANDLSHQIHNIGIVMSEFEEWSYQS
eukprot:402216_1